MAARKRPVEFIPLLPTTLNLPAGCERGLSKSRALNKNVRKNRPAHAKPIRAGNKDQQGRKS